MHHDRYFFLRSSNASRGLELILENCKRAHSDSTASKYYDLVTVSQGVHAKDFKSMGGVSLQFKRHAFHKAQEVVQFIKCPRAV